MARSSGEEPRPRLRGTPGALARGLPAALASGEDLREPGGIDAFLEEFDEMLAGSEDGGGADCDRPESDSKSPRAEAP